MELQLEDEEVAFLLGEKIDSNAVKHLMNDIKRVLDAKEQRMERAIERPRPDAEAKAEKAEVRPQPAPSQRTLF